MFLLNGIIYIKQEQVTPVYKLTNLCARKNKNVVSSENDVIPVYLSAFDLTIVKL